MAYFQLLIDISSILKIFYYLFLLKKTFTASSDYWTTNKVYNVEEGLKSFDDEEAKFQAFDTLPFTRICLGMKTSGGKKWISISKKASSLLAIFRNDNYQATNVGRTTWHSLLSAGWLQPNCNKEGFNIKNRLGQVIVRIGLLGNNEKDCKTPDSFIGFGSSFRYVCGTAKLSAMGYVLIK